MSIPRQVIRCRPTLPCLMDCRAALLEQAEEHDFVIIEDDYESEINVVSHPSPSLKSLDTHGRVIYVGSLSKSLSPGLRIGFMVADETLINEARKLRRLMYRHPPANNQRTCALFISLGHYDSYLRRLKNSYKERWIVMRRAIETYLPECVTPETLGGSAFWLRLPEGVNSKQLAARAKAEGLLIEPGEVQFMQPEKEKNHYIRLGYSAIDVNKISDGIQKLALLLDTKDG